MIIYPAIDLKDGKCVRLYKGDMASIQAMDLAQKFADVGVSKIIYTDIDRDGTGQGVNMISTIQLAQSINIPVIASGGAHSLADLENVKNAAEYGVEGIVLGRALYDKTIDPAEALKVAS